MTRESNEKQSYLRDLFSGHVEVSVPRALRDPASRFVYEAIAWARKHGVHTRTLPTDILPTNDGASTIEGYLMRSDRFATIAYFAFLVLVAGCVVHFAGEGLASPWLYAAGRWLWGASVMLWLATWVVWRRDRIPLLVFIVADPHPVKRIHLRQWLLPGRGQATATWLFARGGLTRPAIAYCEATGIRCLVPHEREFGPPIRPPHQDGPRSLETAA